MPQGFPEARGQQDTNVTQPTTGQQPQEAEKEFSKAGTYRDTVSVEPGSTTVFVSVSVSKRQFLGIEGSKDTFS